MLAAMAGLSEKEALFWVKPFIHRSDPNNSAVVCGPTWPDLHCRLQRAVQVQVLALRGVGGGQK